MLTGRLLITSKTVLIRFCDFGFLAFAPPAIAHVQQDHAQEHKQDHLELVHFVPQPFAVFGTKITQIHPHRH